MKFLKNVINTVGMWIGIKNNMSVRIDISEGAELYEKDKEDDCNE